MTTFVIATGPDSACKALLAQHTDAQVHRLNATSPAKLLVTLERLQATHAVLTSTQLSALRHHPAFDLADLGALTIVYVAGRPDPSDRHDFEEFTVMSLSTQDPSTDLSSDAVADDIESLLAGIDYTVGIEAAKALSEAALRSMLDGLVRSGAFRNKNEVLTENQVLERVRAHPTQRNLMRRWLRILVSKGLICSRGEAYMLPTNCDIHDTAPDWAHVQRLWHAAGDTAETLRFARAASAELPALISGHTQAVHLLFPEGDHQLARAVYRESVAARYQHAAVATCIVHITRLQAGNRLRILEVGGGTGATTEYVLPLLDGLDVDYLFTDVSRFFTHQAAQYHTGLRTSLYDIDRSPSEQGYAPGTFDVIIAGGVLNAARNTDTTLRWLTSLLSCNGWLVVSEPTHEEYWVMASQAFMLAEPDDERAASQTTFLSHAQWLDALRTADLEPVVDLPHSSHPLNPLGHRVFAARPTTHT